MKRMKLITLSLAVLMSSIVFGSATAGAGLKKVSGDWEKLGMRAVDMKVDHDVIVVTHHEGFYTKVKFAIKKAPIYLKNINIIFGNGNNKNITFNKRFAPGTSTRIIDLPGNKRIIKKIKLNYKSVPTAKGRGVVVAWGKH